MEERSQEVMAAAAGMSVRSGRSWESGSLPSQARPERTWRTRSDPFAEVWKSEIAPFLERDEKGDLEVTTLFALEESKPRQFETGQLLPTEQI